MSEGNGSKWTSIIGLVLKIAYDVFSEMFSSRRRRDRRERRRRKKDEED